MIHNCDYYREQAMIDGMDSPAAARWRLHSKNCNACRIEIHVLQTLCQQASEKRQHISHRDYTRLVETVRQLYQPDKQPKWGRFAWSCTWKTAALAALLVVIFKIAGPLGLEKNSGPTRITSPAPASAATEVFARDFTVTAGPERFIAAPAPTEFSLSKADLADLFQTLPGSNIEQDLYRLRRSVSEQIDALSEQLDRELNGEF